MSDAPAHALNLLARGYVEVSEAGQLTAGQRVRHVGEEYYRAMATGTGVLERIFHKPGRECSNRDVEVIVRRDAPRGTDTHGFLPDYHMVPVHAS